MANSNTTKASKTPSTSAKGATTRSAEQKKASPKKTGAAARSADHLETANTGVHTAEAKSRFNAALEEAKAGAAALKAEAEARAGVYREQALVKGDDLVAEARNYGTKAKSRAGELAVEGKNVASDAIASLSKVVADTAPQLDERLGEQYGDFARKASRSLSETSASLEAKSVEQLGEDAREMVRKSPGVAIGIAAVAGFFLARLFRGSRE